MTKRSSLGIPYGITQEQYNNLLKQQDYKCAICFRDNKEPNYTAFCVGHNHTTGKIRGLVCISCNRALGLFQDNPATLKKAYDYLCI